MIDDDEARHAGLRTPRNVVFSKPFTLMAPDDASVTEQETAGELARFAYQVFDTQGGLLLESSDGISATLRRTPRARQQIKALFLQESREVVRLIFQRFRPDGGTYSGEPVFTFTGSEIRGLKDFLDLLDLAELPDAEGHRLDLSALRSVVKTPEARQAIYSADREAVYTLIESDETARDVVALARRRSELDVFDRLLHDPKYFESVRVSLRSKRPEDVWQNFFERNRWIFGLGLSQQLLLSWDESKLEQTVRGASVAGGGKRADGLMRTMGTLSSLCFVEIKRHDTPLLAHSSKRSDTWAASTELSEAIAQCHSTIDAAQEAIQRNLKQEDHEGFEMGLIAYLCRPRSFLVIGQLDEFLRGGRPNERKFRSFENLRRTLQSPDVITFDELFERASFVLGIRRPTTSLPRQEDERAF